MDGEDAVGGAQDCPARAVQRPAAAPALLAIRRCITYSDGGAIKDEARNDQERSTERSRTKHAAIKDEEAEEAGAEKGREVADKALKKRDGVGEEAEGNLKVLHCSYDSPSLNWRVPTFLALV